MHIPDGVLSPSMTAATTAVGAVGFLYCLKRVERKSGERTVALTGMLASFVFAAQMVKFPVFPGVAGHLLGGVLASVLLGPWAGATAIGSVLIVQCVLFGDGGLSALGANFINMGMVGALGGYAIYAPIRRSIGGASGVLLGAMAASWLSVLLGAGAFSIELGLGGAGPFLLTLGLMSLVHAGIGLGEALITGLVVRFLLLTRPDLIDQEYPPPTPITKAWQAAYAGLAASLVVAVFLGPFAWDSPDGLEFVGGRLGFLKDHTPAILKGLWPNYQIGISGAGAVRVATAAAGLIGTVVVFVVGLAMTRAMVRRKVKGIGPDVA